MRGSGRFRPSLLRATCRALRLPGAAAVAATLLALIGAQDAVAHEPGPADCRTHAVITRLVTGSTAKARAASRACRRATTAHVLVHPLPDAEVPSILRRIRDCESGLRDRSGRAIPASHRYRAENGGTRGSNAAAGDSDASGAYQFLDSTWGTVNVRGVGTWTHAADAPPRVQDRRAIRHHAQFGTAPWSESRGCWG